MENLGDIDFTPEEYCLEVSEAINNITIEHAYSGELIHSEVINEVQYDPVDSTSNNSFIQEPTVESLPEPVKPIQNPVEMKPKEEELTMEQVAEKVKSRELKSLLEATRESNLETNIAHKRESRKSIDPFYNKNEHNDIRRTMRSQNSDFIGKNQKFLHKINKYETSLDEASQLESESGQKREYGTKTLKKRKDIDDDAVGGSSVEEKKNRKLLKTDNPNNNLKKDKDLFCWRCHRDNVIVQCETCPRAFHLRCLKQPIYNPDHWTCPECLSIIQADSTKTRSPAMKDISLEHLCELLNYAAKRMITCAGSEPFLHPVDLKTFPDYRSYVIHPMDLTTIQNNIRNNFYGSTTAFLAEAKWILHNSIIYNSYQSKLTTAAKNIVKICKQEMSEIETCSECYLNANTKKNSWFVEVCSKPHILLWAKLKGFPYWPAKAMITNSAGLVDVRFFGAHDRAWVPIKECFLYSKKDPNTTNKQKRNNIAECVKEVDIHIDKLKEKYGDFIYAPYRTSYDPNNEAEQLALMLPKYKSGGKLKALPSSNNAKIENGEAEKKVLKKIKMNRSSDEIDEQDEKNSISSGSLGERLIDELETLTSSSKTSINSNDKVNLKYATNDYEKFMEGYGTEDDETTALTLNDEVRKKIVLNDSDSEDEEINSKQVNEENDNHESECEIKNKFKKIEISRKRSLAYSPNDPENPSKLSRRNSDMSIKSDSSRISGISDKISRVEEFSDNLEVSLANISRDSATVSFSEMMITPEKKNRSEFTPVEKADLGKLKPVIQVSTGDLYNKNKEFKISPQNKSISIAEKLMKKISESDIPNELESVETVKKQIIENLESSSSSLIIDEGESQEIVYVSSSENNETENDANSKSNTDVIEPTYSTNKPEKSKINERRFSKENQKEATSSKEKDEKIEDKNVSSSSETVQKNKNSKEPTAIVLLSKEKEIDIEVTKISTNTEVAQTSSDKKNIPEKPEIRIRPVRQVRKTAKIVDESSEEDEFYTSEEEQEDSDMEPLIGIKNQIKSNSNVKLVNVSDIISGKVDNTPSQKSEQVKITITKSTTNQPAENISETSVPQNKNNNIQIESIEIKTEPLSDEENTGEKETEKDKSSTKKNDQETDKEITKAPFQIVDNLTRVIDSVASNYNAPLSLRDKKEITIRPISKLVQTSKQKARKSFPNSPHKMFTTPVKTYLTEREIQKSRMHTVNVKIISTSQQNVTNSQSINSISNISGTSTSVSSTSITNNLSKQQDNNNMVYITPQPPPIINNMGILPANQPITLTQNVGNSILAMVQHHGITTPSLIIQQTPTNTQTTSVSQTPIVAPMIVTTSAPCITTSQIISTTTSSNTNANSTTTASQSEPEINVMNGEPISVSLAKAVGELFCKSPPALKPRPPGPLSTQFDEGVPSTAGTVTRTINSVSHRFSDYFRCLLKETLQDLSQISCPEAKIRSLELELEALKHKHAEEMLELRKNISSILKDIQKSIIEDKAKIVEETRAVCEAERLRCIEETKTKQWCAYCFKEAQFYCCWNTSYCDYPCQQKHWPSHMSSCSQSRNSHSGVSSTPGTSDKSSINSQNKQLPKTINNNNKTVLKQTRMIVKHNKGAMYVPIQRPMQGTQQTITLLESTPGNFEILGNHGPISLGGKLVPTTTIKVKPGNVITVASSSNSSNITTTTGSGGQKTFFLAPKTPQIMHKTLNENKA